MPTTSTKSRAVKEKREKTSESANAAKASEPVIALAHTGSELSRRAWLIASGAILILATLLRVFELELKPLHHDEGVNGFFLLNLMRNGVYHYDPANYHGPTLYYFALPLAYLLDHFHHLSTWTIRLVPAAFGLATIWLVLSLRRYIGMIGALSAAALLAVSPGSVYLSRYFIHEMLFVFFTLGIVVAALKFYGSERGVKEADGKLAAGGVATSVGLVLASLIAVYYPNLFAAGLTVAFFCLSVTLISLWSVDGERAPFLVLSAICAALLFATKETAFISAIVLVLATILAWSYVGFGRRQGWLREQQPRAKKKRGKQTVQTLGATPLMDARSLFERLGGWSHIAFLLATTVAIFLFVNILFYSSFFTNAKGVMDSLQAFKIWSHTGNEAHQKPIYTYVKWLWDEEAPMLLLGTAGTLFALWRVRNRFAVFTAAWAFGMLAAYSLVPYKTPWLVLSVLIPLAVIGGYAIEMVYKLDTRRTSARLFALAPLAVALAFSLYQAITLNFIHYDDDSYIYVYAHTRREFTQLISEVEKYAQLSGKGYETNINVPSPDYWPMPWYLRDYKHVGYTGTVGQTTDAIVIGNVSQVPQLQALLGDRYDRVGETYTLRPGVDLVLYVRRDLAGAGGR